jgi:hypothetical protein
MMKARTIKRLDDSMACMQGTCLNVLQWINALRLVCNHGAAQIPQLEDEQLNLDKNEPWKAPVAQRAFNNMLAVGTATCFRCETDMISLLEQGLHKDNGQMHLSRCLSLFCGVCLAENADTNMADSSLCGHYPRCAMAKVSMRDLEPQKRYPSISSSSLPDAPSKIKALLYSLQLFKDTEKRFIDQNPTPKSNSLKTNALQRCLLLLDQNS